MREKVKIYQDNIQKHKETVIELSKSLEELSWSRLVVFVFMVFIVIGMAKTGEVAIILFLVLACGLGFMFLVRRHNEVTHQKKHATFLKETHE